MLRMFYKEVTGLRRLLWANLVLGIWLMLSPFVLRILYKGIFKTTWEDFILGFAIALISFGRLFSHTTEEILVTDWIVTVAAILTFINPLLYNYYNIRLATVNNLVTGGVVCLFAIYVDWKDSHRLS